MSSHIATSNVSLQPNSPAEQDIHICGSCKLQFNSIHSFLSHKRLGCGILAVNETPQKAASTSPLQNVDDSPKEDTDTLANASSSIQVAPSTFAAPPRDNSNVESNPVKPSQRKKFQCEVSGCQYSTCYQKDLIRHMRVHTGERPFECQSCGKSFNRADKLKMHERWHTGFKPYKCKHCDYATSDSSSLKKHQRIHTDERPFKCQICPYASRNSSQLVVHLRTHTGDCPFFCPVCNMKFKINSDLKRHLRMHTGEKPYTCQFCNYKCAIKGNLKTHMRLNHSAENLQKCGQCDYVSPSRKALKEHEKTHDTKAVKCPQCPYTCTTRAALRNHVRVHSSDKPFKCELCPYASRQPGNVRTHVKKRHPETLNHRLKKGMKAKMAPVVAVTEESSSESRKFKSRPLCVKSFRCSFCEAAFVREDSLRSHMRQHKERLKQLEGAAIAVLQLSNPALMSPSSTVSQFQDREDPSELLNEAISTVPVSTSAVTTNSDLSMALSPLSTTPQAQVIEQALQQSGVLEESRVSSADQASLTTQVVTYVHNNSTVDHQSVLTTMNLKPSQTQVTTSLPIEMSGVSNLETTTVELNSDTNLNAHHHQQFQSTVCSLQPQMMYHLPAGLNLLPLLSLGSQNVATPAAPSYSNQPTGTTQVLTDQTSNIQYIVHTTPDINSAAATAPFLVNSRSNAATRIMLPQNNAEVELVHSPVGTSAATKVLNCVSVRMVRNEDGNMGGLLTNLTPTCNLGTLVQPVLLATSQDTTSDTQSEPLFVTTEDSTIPDSTNCDKATSTLSDLNALDLDDSVVSADTSGASLSMATNRQMNEAELSTTYMTSSNNTPISHSGHLPS